MKREREDSSSDNPLSAHANYKRSRTVGSKYFDSHSLGHGSYPSASYAPYAPLITAVSTERRRVNPESLALRLGPELVRELDALIEPGNMDMPSFAARKGVQERFNLDRRHVYDYFHSKGLRVVKEDKHTNLSRARARQAAAPKALQEGRLPDVRRKSTRPVPPRSPSLSTQGSVAPTPTPAIVFESSSQHLRSSRNAAITPEPELERENLSPSANSSPCHTRTYLIVNPLANSFLSNIPDEDPFDLYAINNPSSYCDPSPPLDLQLTPPASPSDRTLTAALYLSPSQQPPTKPEREACYARLDRDLGPPRGIQQLVGSYKFYMAERARLYYERILPPDYLKGGADSHESASGSTDLFDCGSRDPPLLQRMLSGRSMQGLAEGPATGAVQAPNPKTLSVSPSPTPRIAPGYIIEHGTSVIDQDHKMIEGENDRQDFVGPLGVTEGGIRSHAQDTRSANANLELSRLKPRQSRQRQQRQQPSDNLPALFFPTSAHLLLPTTRSGQLPGQYPDEGSPALFLPQREIGAVRLDVTHKGTLRQGDLRAPGIAHAGGRTKVSSHIEIARTRTTSAGGM